MDEKNLDKKFNYEKWYNDYCNKRFISLSEYFDKNDLIILNKLDIILEEKIYTEREFELMDMSLYEYYEENEDNEIIESDLLKEKLVTKEEYKKVLDMFTKISRDYNL